MSINSTAGSKLFIGTALEQKPTDFVEGDFTAQTWVEIAWIETLGALGDSSAEIPFIPISTQRDMSLKGSKNAGTMAIVAGIDATDPGQLAVIAAQANKNDFAFKLVLNDAPAVGASPKGSERKFIGKVMSASEQLDGANSVMKLNMSLRINSNIVRKAASAT